MNLRSSVCVLAAVLAAPAWAAPASQAVGRTDLRELAGIVTDGAPTRFEKMAAAEMSRTLARAYGVRLVLNPKGIQPVAGAKAILLGNAALKAGLIRADELKDLWPDGFVVRSRGGAIGIAGPRESGTLYGAMALLEKLGCRYYGPDCRRYPKAPKSVVNDFELSDKPFFTFRTPYDWRLGGAVREEMMGDPRRAENPNLFGPGAGSNIYWHHTAGYLVPTKPYRQKHPEFYAMWTNGKRMPRDTKDHSVHLCMSNAAAREIARKRLLKWMKLQPGRRVFWIAQGDGLQWCQCKKCKAMDVYPGNYSDRMIDWANDLARAVKKDFPRNELAILAYCGTYVGPVRAKCEDNLLIFYCPYWGVALSEVHPLTHESNAEALKQFNSWRKMAPERMCIFDYNMGNAPTWDAMAAKVKWAAKQGVKGFHLCGRPGCFRDMFSYIVGKLLWNPDLNAEALKKDFVEAYYGPAAPHVMAYLTLVKERLAKGFPRGIHQGHMPAEYYDDGVKDQAVGLFDKMLAAAEGDNKLAGKLTAEKKVFLDDWKRATTKRKPREPAPPENIDNGVRLGGAAFIGGREKKNFKWECPPRPFVTFVYSPTAQFPSTTQATFHLDDAPKAATLEVEANGGDKDLAPETSIRILVNGQKVFEGPCGFIKRNWSWRKFDVPAGVLKKGANTIRFENFSQSRRCDHYWLGVSEVRIIFK